MIKNPIIEVNELHHHFKQSRSGLGKQKIHAINGISLTLFKGETLGLVGETGCGKSTLSKVLTRLYKPTMGTLNFNGVNISRLPERKLKFLRERVQMIFQDPSESMNSRLNIGYIIEEPLIIQTKMSARERKLRALELLDTVGLPKDSYYRYPHEFSGGQRQRVAIARAIALNPEVIICDEAVSALDVSIQAQILNLLLDLQARDGLTILFISHDLSVVRHMSDRVAVMYLGTIVEISTAQSIYTDAKHPYTLELIDAIPRTNPLEKRGKKLSLGEVPSSVDLPEGCVFHNNCPKSMEICKKLKPKLNNLTNNHEVACHLY